MHAKLPQPLGQAGVVGRDEPAVSEAAEVLRRKKGKCPRRSNAAGAAAVVRSAPRLCAVLDHRHLPGHVAERPHVRRLTEEMDGNDGPRAGAHLCFHCARVEAEITGIDVGEDRCGAEPGDGPGRREEGEDREDHLVARTDAERHHRDEQRIGAGAHSNRMGDAQRPGRLPFERLDLGSQDETLGITDAVQNLTNLFTQRRILTFQVE